MPILTYYDPSKEMILQTDVNIKGLDACILEQGRSVYFTSKAHTETQKGYVAMELESLAVARAMKSFIISYTAPTAS